MLPTPSHVQSIKSISSQVVQSFQCRDSVPQATFHVLKAVLYVLGKEPATFSNWKRCYEHFTPDLFQQLQDLDATADRDMDAWKKARCAYKGLVEAKQLDAEFPESCVGSLLLMWLKQCRKVARKALTHRTAIKAAEDLNTTLEAKKVALEEAIKKKEEEEEAARKAAEEEAARAAAEGAEGGEAEEGEAEE